MQSVAISGAMAGSAAGYSAAAAGAAPRAHVSECKAVIAMFDSKTATTSEMQEYAGCVDFLMPKDDEIIPQGDAIAVLLSIIIGAVVGWWTGRRDMPIMLAVLGAICGPLVLLVLGGIVWLIGKAVGAF